MKLNIEDFKSGITRFEVTTNYQQWNFKNDGNLLAFIQEEISADNYEQFLLHESIDNIELVTNHNQDAIWMIDHKKLEITFVKCESGDANTIFTLSTMIKARNPQENDDLTIIEKIDWTIFRLIQDLMYR